MDAPLDGVPEDVSALKAALLAERGKHHEAAARAVRVEAELAVAKAKASDDEALIAHQQLQIEKLTRQLYGHRSERSVRLLDQMVGRGHRSGGASRRVPWSRKNL